MADAGSAPAGTGKPRTQVGTATFRSSVLVVVSSREHTRAAITVSKKKSFVLCVFFGWKIGECAAQKHSSSWE